MRRCRSSWMARTRSSKSLNTSGSSYSAQWKKFSWSSISPPAAGTAVAARRRRVSSPQAASSTLPENTATAEPAMKCRRVIRCAVARDARIFTPSNSSAIRVPLSSSFCSGRGRIRQDHRRLSGVEHVHELLVPPAPDVAAHLQLRRSRSWAAGRGSPSAPGVTTTNWITSPRCEMPASVPRTEFTGSCGCSSVELHRLRPDRGQGGPAVDRIRRLCSTSGSSIHLLLRQSRSRGPCRRRSSAVR